MVPKSLYRTAEELESEENRLLTDSIYKSASIFKGAPYEVQSGYISSQFQFLCMLDFYAVDSGATTWKRSTLQACSESEVCD